MIQTRTLSLQQIVHRVCKPHFKWGSHDPRLFNLHTKIIANILNCHLVQQISTSCSLFSLLSHSLQKKYYSTKDENVEIFDLSKFLKNIENITKQTLEDMKKVGPERSDSLYTATLKISGN